MKRIFALLALAGLLPGLARAAPPPSHQTMTYAVYAGGINALATNLTIAIDGAGRYDIALSTQTRGLLGHLAPWHGTFETKGVRPAAAAARASGYQGTAVWRDETQYEGFSYAADGTLASHKVIDHGKDKSPSLDHALADGTTDALTATLNMLDAVALGRLCATGTQDVYDGLRRYKLVFHDEGRDMLPGSQYATYKGPAERCTAEVVPNGGRWHDRPRGWLNIQEQGRQRGALPTVWLARVDANGPAIPVRVKVVTSYGTLFMQLTSYKKD